MVETESHSGRDHGRYEDVLQPVEAGRERQRLNALCDELDTTTKERITALGLLPEWRCLEIGAGTGTIARWLAARCHTGTVTATDVDLRFLRSEPGVTIVRHDLTTDGFPDSGFDLIHARYVFAHLRDRDRLLEKAVRWLAPGGWLIVEDPARFPIESSEHTDYREVSLHALDIYQEVMGTDTDWPRQFPEPLRKLGLRNIGSHGSLSTVGANTAMSRFWASTLRNTSDLLVERGVKDKDRIESVAAQLEATSFSDLGMATIAAWGRRPA